jgi:hypothetical protein
MGSMENLRKHRADKGPGYKRWWATEEAPSPMILALLIVTGLSGLFVVANLVIEAILN